MTAKKQQGQGVVCGLLIIGIGCGGEQLRGRDVCGGGLAPSARLVAAELVCQPAGSHSDQPRARIRRYALSGPLNRGSK